MGKMDFPVKFSNPEKSPPSAAHTETRKRPAFAVQLAALHSIFALDALSGQRQPLSWAASSGRLRTTLSSSHLVFSTDPPSWYTAASTPSVGRDQPLPVCS